MTPSLRLCLLAPAVLAALAACKQVPAPGTGPGAQPVMGPARPAQPVLPSMGPAQPARLAQAADACAVLARQALPQLSINQATLVPGGSQRARDPANREVGAPLPEHCLVQGRLDERTGADGKPYYTGFELRLPTAFNGRFFYQGGGGNDGIIRNAVGRTTGQFGWANHVLGRGFAVVATDAGHQGQGPEFGLDPQARIEHAYRAHERTARTALTLLHTYYGRPANKRYFFGCSGGGRQGMMFAQRFPDLFDGVIAMAPAMRVSEGATIAAAWTVQKLQAVAPTSGGQPVGLLAQAVEDRQLKRVAQEVLQQCDASDGLKDGLVQDPFCRLNLAAVQCPAGGPDCLRADQVRALAEVMAGPRNAGGPLYFSWPWDPGIATPDWRAWTMGTVTPDGQPNARHVTLMAGALGHEFVTPPDPSLSTLNFDFERDPPRMQAFHKVYGSADDVQLAGFRQRGGKLIFIHGLADPIFSAHEMIDYQQRLNATHGASGAAQFARTFLVPGMNHCAGGPATDDFDALPALQAWVEEGRAPARIEARGSGTLPATLQRPLCPWPQQARYNTGDANQSNSFVCR